MNPLGSMFDLAKDIASGKIVEGGDKSSNKEPSQLKDAFEALVGGTDTGKTLKDS